MVYGVLALLVLIGGVFLFFGERIFLPTGYFTLLDLAPTQFIFVEPAEGFGGVEARLALEHTQEEIGEMRQLNVSTGFMSDALEEAQAAYLEGDYLQVARLTQLVSYVRAEKLEFLDRKKLLEEKLRAAEEEGVATFQSTDLVGNAIRAFGSERFDQANELLAQASAHLEKEKSQQRKGAELQALERDFFTLYWWQAGLLFLVVGAGLSTLVMFYHQRKVRR